MTAKKFVSAISAAIMLSACLTGCNESTKDSTVDTTDSQQNTPDATSAETEGVSDDTLLIIYDGIEGLRNLEMPYMVSTGVSSPIETMYYVELADENGTYAQYAVGEDGTLGATPYEMAEGATFMIVDYITTDGKGYMLNQAYEPDGESTQWLAMPDKQAEVLSSRKILYLDTLKDGMHDFTEAGSIQADLGYGAVELTLYNGTIDSEYVAKILGYDTLGMYEALYDEAVAKNDDNMIALLERYIADLKMNLTFSDADAWIGLYNGAVRYISFDVGGLGSRMTYSKIVLAADENLLYDLPKFGVAEPYYAGMSELADYVAQYGSYDEAMQALYGGYGTGNSEELPDVGETPDTDEIQETGSEDNQADSGEVSDDDIEGTETEE